MMKEILTTKCWNILAHKLRTFVSFVVIFDFLVWLLLTALGKGALSPTCGVVE